VGLVEQPHIHVSYTEKYQHQIIADASYIIVVLYALICFRLKAICWHHLSSILEFSHPNYLLTLFGDIF
jgi:hypothetical protein